MNASDRVNTMEEDGGIIVTVSSTRLLGHLI